MNHYSELLQRMIGCAALCVLVAVETPSQTKYVDIRWYDSGTVTASGEKFNPNSLTCASKSLKFGTLVDITYGSVILSVRVNDRGPALVEITKGAFSKLADPNMGVLHAKIQIK